MRLEDQPVGFMPDKTGDKTWMQASSASSP